MRLVRNAAAPDPPVVVAVSMDTVRFITSLLRDLPATNADLLNRAAWFDRKADVFDRICTEDDALAEEAARLAEGARAEADRLRREAAA